MFTVLIEKLRRREDLTEAEASAVMNEIMAGRAEPAQIAGMLMTLSMKGERPAEIVGFARAMRGQAVRLTSPAGDVFDTCGTGGDRLDTFNVSSVSALTVAACGVRVAKHGNRSASSACGSADLFEALGVNVTASPTAAEECLRAAGIAFFFAPTFHPSMRHAAPVRRSLGVRTAFNLLGPLTNPAGAARQIVGVSRPEHTELMARALGELGTEHVWVVHGTEGLDEISIAGYTKVSALRHGMLRTFYLHPGDLGLDVASIETVQVSEPAESVAVATRVLEGAQGPARDFVLANAGPSLFVAGRAGSPAEGVRLAAAALDDGRAARTLEQLVRHSQEGGGV